MGLPNPSMSFSPFAILTAEEMNDLVENIESLADGSGIGTNAIAAANLATSAITLGYAPITTATFNAGTTAIQVTGLSVTATIPDGGRRVKITGYAGTIYSTVNANAAKFSIWDGAVGSGTQLAVSRAFESGGSGTSVGLVMAVVTPSAGSKTYNIGLQSDTSGNATIESSATSPSFLLVEMI